MTKLRDGRPRNRYPIPSQGVSGAHLASGLMGTYSLFRGIKRSRRYVHHSTHPALKNMWSYPFTPPYALTERKEATYPLHDRLCKLPSLKKSSSPVTGPEWPSGFQEV